jgi:TRAP-type C4-dicarboxylate transport system permease small subunit
MHRRLDRLCRAIEAIGGVFLGVITAIVFVSAIGRYLFAAPIPDSFDVSRLLLGVVVMWGFASVGYRGAHIKVDFLVEHLPAAIRRWIDLVAWLILLLFTLLLAWKMFGRVASAWSSNESTFNLRLPVWPLMALVWAGVVASVIAILARLVMMATGRRAGSELEHPVARTDDRDADER